MLGEIGNIAVEKYIDQIIAGTCEDGHGEKYSKEFFESLLANHPNRMPLNQKHDMGLPVVGYLENFRLVPSKLDDGEWELIAHIYITKGDLDSALKGFSFSAPDIKWENLESPSAYILVPYPAYNNEELIRNLVHLSTAFAVGKWVKKGLGIETLVGLIATAIVLVISPEWDIQYKQYVRPKLINLLSTIKPLNDEGVSVTLLQRIYGYCKEEIEVYFIPDESNNLLSHSESNIHIGLNKAISYISRDNNAKTIGVYKITLLFDLSQQQYILQNIIYRDGSEMKIV